MASNYFGILAKAKAPKRPFTKFPRLKKQKERLRFYSAVCFGKSERKPVPLCRNFSSPDSFIIKSSSPEITIPDALYHELLLEFVPEFETRVAVECPVSGKVVDYITLYKNSKALGASLQSKFKLQKGDVQALILPNCVEYPKAILGAAMVGIVTSTINPQYTSTEIGNQMLLVECKVVYTTPEIYPKCMEALNESEIEIPVIVIKFFPDDVIPEGAISFDELLDNPGDFEPVEVKPDDLLLLPFSSGTSGLPKGVELSHKNVTANLLQLQTQKHLLKKHDEMRKQISALCILPQFHVYGLCTTLEFFRQGDRLVLLPKFEPDVFIKTLSTIPVEVLFLVPPLVIFLGYHPSVNEGHFESIRNICSGGAPCGETDLLRLLSKGKHMKVIQGYGATETTSVVTLSNVERMEKLASAGQVISNTLVKVVDVESRTPLGPGHLGEILIKGPQVTRGYYKRVEETNAAFDSDGWFKTGDIGYYDEDFDFYIVDRTKDLIKVKGFQVSPAELEEFLRNHPKIIEAGVIGVQHPELGQVPKAFVVLKKGFTMTEDEVKTYVKDNLSSHKELLGGVMFMKEIPKSSSGKILRKDLKSLFGDPI